MIAKPPPPFDAGQDLKDAPHTASRLRPRDAATLILVRRGRSGPEVLMGRRAPGHVFMASKWVFPGGRVERTDYAPPYAADLPGEEMAILKREVPERRARALALAAVRETHEETGVILGRPAPPRPVSGPWRAFLASGHQPDLSPLRYVARAVTPPGRPRRFDARFFMAETDDLALPPPDSHGDELDQVAWMALQSLDDLALPAITRFVVGEIRMRLEGTDPGRPFVRQIHGRHQVTRF